MSATTANPPAIPPRPARSQEKASTPMIPPRPTKRAQRPISPNPDRYAPSPLNDAAFLKSPKSLDPAAYNQDPIPRSTSVDLPSLGEEGQEYAEVAEKLSLPKEESASPEQTRTVADDLKLHAPKPSLPASSAKQRVMAVTRTDSERAASFGIGRPSSVDDSTMVLPSNRSLKKKASTASQLSTTESHFDDEHGIPEIGLQVPMYKNAGDVQAPSPAPAAAEKARHHARRTSGRGNLPPGSYGLHGHGVAPQDKLEKAYYEKHPDLLKKEHMPHHYDRPNDFSMTRDDLNKIVRETASRGSGLGAKDYAGTPSEQVGWQALEESASRIASPEVKPVLKPASPASDTDKESHHKISDVIHVDEPNRRRSVMFSDTESVNNADEEVERPYTAPILADDEVAKDPSALAHQPAVEPPAFELEESHSRPSSRPTSLHKETSFELRSTPLEDVEEYEPLFKDDEKEEAKKPKEEKLGKNNNPHRFPSADVWEDAPSSAYYTTEVSTPDLFDEQEKPSPPVVSPPREGETAAQAFARHQEELAEKETRERGPEGFISAHNTQKPLWAQHQKHLIAEKASSSRPIMQQRFPSRDVWEDAPDSLQLETTVSTPQQDEEASPSPADNLKPEIPERPQPKSTSTLPGPNTTTKPAIPERPKPRQPSADATAAADKPAIPDRPKPKPQIPARPVKAGTTSADLEPAETAAPPPRQKPAVPARPMGSKIAALQAGFMNDLNRRLQLGLQAPPKRGEHAAEEEKPAEEEKEKVPLSDARKGRARGPQRRAPARVAPAVEVPKEEEEEEESKGGNHVLGFSKAVRFFEIDSEEGVLSAGGVREDEGKAAEAKPELQSGAEVEDESEEGKKSPEAEVKPEEKKGIVGMVKDTIKAVVAGPAEEAKQEGEKARTEEEKGEKEDVEESKAESELRPEPEEAEEDDEAKPDPEPEKRETKSLATNMAGETLIKEEVKEEEQGGVEPVKVVEEK
ncbi:hypothetical protein VTI74DRAFT_1844 [Chaetomium olivicolor]